jgi:hypothetical protein
MRFAILEQQMLMIFMKIWKNISQIRLLKNIWRVKIVTNGVVLCANILNKINENEK